MAMSVISHWIHKPKGPLERYVREILWVRSGSARKQVLLPETTLTLAFRQSGSVRLRNQVLPTATVSGLQQRSRTVEHEAGSSLIIVRFTELGAPAILHDRADLLYNQTASLDALLPQREIARLHNKLADGPEVARQVLAVEDFLSNQLQGRNEISPQIEAAAAMIRSSEGRSSVAAIARRVGMSQSALERRFRAAVGASPKMLSRLVRLQHVCRLWDARKSLTEIAFEAGYCDQPHLVRDFRLFTGTPPEEFFRSVSPRNLPTFYK
jgi:AraC-like DNA-binding protein